MYVFGIFDNELGLSNRHVSSQGGKYYAGGCETPPFHRDGDSVR